MAALARPVLRGTCTSRCNGGNAEGLLGTISACVRGIRTSLSVRTSDLHGRRKCSRIVGNNPCLATTTLVRIDQVDQDLLDVLIELGELERGAIGRRAYDLGGQTAVQVLSFTAKLHH